MAVAQSEFSDAIIQPPAPETLTQEQLLGVMEHADILESWLKSVRGFIQAKLESGEEVPGWKLVEKRATRKWVSESAVEEWAQENGQARPERHWSLPAREAI